MNPPHKWTEDEIEKLKKLWYEENKTKKEISAILGINYRSVTGFMFRSKLKKQKNWTEDEKTLLKQLYPDFTVKTIAEKMNRTQSSIKSMIQELELLKRINTEWSDDELNILQDLYPKNISQEEILSKLNNKTWAQASSKAIQKFNLKRPVFRSYNVIHDYFENITTIEQAYILGFIAADGCVNKRGYGLAIGVHNKDKKLLDWVISEICPDYEIKHSETKTTNKNMEIFIISNKQIHSDLQKYNMIPQKTYNLQWPDSLPENLEMPFIIGFFDGDGSISFKRLSNNKVDWAWEICGAQFSFIETVKEKIYKHTGINACGPTPKKDRESFYRISLSGKNIYDIDEYFMQYDIGLQRKRIKYFWEHHEIPEELQ